jgi:hypothetical protein
MVEASNWYLPIATARTLAHKTTRVKPSVRIGPPEACAEPAQASRRLSSVTIR